jgi:anhydro-N-acetylmuramic acid kinase
MDLIAKIRKMKKKKVLVLSAASLDSGIQCLYLESSREEWNIISQLNLAYPQPIKTMCESLISCQPGQVGVHELARLEARMSFLYAECCHSLLSHVSKLFKQPDCIVVNRLQLWKTPLETCEAQFWDYAVGDCQVVADQFRTAVMSDFVRSDLLRGGKGILPTHMGDLRIGQKIGPVAFFVNLGMIARMTIIDTRHPAVLLDMDAGPGTCLVNLVAQQAGLSDGFDRDGLTAASGSVDTAILDEISAHPLFVPPLTDPMPASALRELLSTPSLRRLSEADKLATIGALTARSVSLAYQREFKHEQKPASLWISGGGANNLALMEYFKSYFSPMEVKSIEELGIPADSRIPLSLGLSVAAYLDNQKNVLRGEGRDDLIPPGRWILPACG